MKLLSTFCRLALLLLIALPSLAQSKVIFVDGSVSTSGDGTSWATAYQTLQEALNTAISGVTAGDQIRVASGIYKPTTTSSDPRDATFLIPSGVKVYGGYTAGTNTRNLGSSYLNGDIDNNDARSIAETSSFINGDNSYHVVSFINASDQTRLDGFTIGAGKANGGTPDLDMGGGVFIKQNDNTSSAPVLVNCRFWGNYARAGGALCNKATQGTTLPTLINCVFRGNYAADLGGAIYNHITEAGTPGMRLTNCSLEGNISPLGGALANQLVGEDSPADPGSIILTNCILWNNGGANAIYLNNTGNNKPTLTNSLIEPDETDYTGTGTITSDPYWNQSLRLNACSPAINAGINAAPDQTGMTTDLVGNNRIIDGTIDLGAYENTTGKYLVYYVDAAATGTNTGTSWANAFTSLQPVLEIACNGIEIRVAQGVYKPTADPNDQNASFQIPSGVKVLGGYIAGTDNRILGSSILSGDIDNNDLNDDQNNIAETSQAIQGSNSNRIVLFLDTDNQTRLDGFTITASNSYGGIQMYGIGKETAPIITNCRFYGNYASQGGAIHIFANGANTAPSVINCAFSGNAAQIGGAVYSTLSGGALSSPRFVNCTFGNNRATSEGAAIGHYGTTLTLINCILWNNEGAKAIAKRSYNAAVAATNCLIEPSATGYTGTSTLTSNPVWNTDLTLTACSPAINAGLTPVEELAYSALGGIPVDAAGQFRFYNGTADLGAYEFQSAFVPLPVTITPASNTVLAGQTVILTAAGTGTDYSWSTGAISPAITVTALVGTNSYSVTATNASGCSGTAVAGIKGLIATTLNGPASLCVKATPPTKAVVTLPVNMTVAGDFAIKSYRWAYKAPGSNNYKEISDKGVTIGKITFKIQSSTLSLTGEKGNLNGLAGYLLQLTITDSRNVSLTAITQLDGNCSLPNAREGFFSAEEVQVNVYPNPVVEHLTVEVSSLCSPATVHLYDIQGRVRGYWTIEPVEGAGRIKASVADLSEGIYILNVEAADGLLHRQRVLKQR